MDPTQPSQPSLNTAYTHPHNPATSTTQEDHENTSTAATQNRSNPTQETRSPNDLSSSIQSNANPSSLAYGVQDASSDRPNALGSDAASNTEGEQMRAAGEGDIAAAQDTKDGFGEEGSLTGGLERKKAEQAGIREERRGGGGGGDEGGVDVEAAMSGKDFVGAPGNQRSEVVGEGGALDMQSGHGQV